MNIHEFCDAVEIAVQTYGHWDGGDLCHSLIEQGVVNMDDGVDAAARTVAQHIEQA